MQLPITCAILFFFRNYQKNERWWPDYDEESKSSANINDELVNKIMCIYDFLFQIV